MRRSRGWPGSQRCSNESQDGNPRDWAEMRLGRRHPHRLAAMPSSPHTSPAAAKIRTSPIYDRRRIHGSPGWRFTGPAAIVRSESNGNAPANILPLVFRGGVCGDAAHSEPPVCAPRRNPHTAIFKMLLRAGKVVDVTIGQQVISADLTPTGLERLARLLLTREALDWTALEQAMQMSAPQAG